ncbi:aspartate carbamoyltransferase regulatory subunit [Caldiplasma sukawensis]
MEAEKILKVGKIKDGTVIDHISAGKGITVLKVLGLLYNTEMTISVLMNVSSRVNGKKDIVKIENRSLEKNELDRISILSPGATINVIREFKIEKKFRVELPQEIMGTIVCSNQNCVTNHREPVRTIFRKEENRGSTSYRCYYCQRTMSLKEIEQSLNS